MAIHKVWGLSYFTRDEPSKIVNLHALYILRALKIFFSLYCFGGTEALIVFLYLCCPLEDSLQWKTIPDGSPSKDWQSTVGWGDYWIPSQDCSFNMWYPYQLVTTAPLVSHHCSPLSHHCSPTLIEMKRGNFFSGDYFPLHSEIFPLLWLNNFFLIFR
jgi:hypothetical protein